MLETNWQENGGYDKEPDARQLFLLKGNKTVTSETLPERNGYVYTTKAKFCSWAAPR